MSKRSLKEDQNTKNNEKSLTIYKKQNIKNDNKQNIITNNNSKQTYTLQPWQKETSNYLNKVEHQININNNYYNAHGFILANDIGLGKTLNIIDVILQNPADYKFDIDNNINSPASLILAPSQQLVKQWQNEIKQQSDDLLIPKMINNMNEFNKIRIGDIKQKYIILIVSTQFYFFEQYNKQNNYDSYKDLKNNGQKHKVDMHYNLKKRSKLPEEDYNDNNFPLHFKFIKFHRLIVDEVKQGIMDINAKIQQYISGTPYENDIGDQLLRFIRYNNMDDILDQNDDYDYDIINCLLEEFYSIRQLLNDIDDKQFSKISYSIIKIKLNNNEKKLYNIEQEKQQNYIKDPINMRMVCCHPDYAINHLVEHEKNILFGDDCVICQDPITQPCLTKCGHTQCQQCLKNQIIINNECPRCKTILNDDDSKHNIILNNDIDYNDYIKIDLSTQYGSKMTYLLKYLKKVINEDEINKIIIFSQQNSNLNKISKILTKEEISNIIISGYKKCNSELIQDFQNNINQKVLILSGDQASAGLNIIAATHVVIYESISKSLEDQAIGRTYRLGQDKNITVLKLICENTIEDVELQ